MQKKKKKEKQEAERETVELFQLGSKSKHREMET